MEQAITMSNLRQIWTATNDSHDFLRGLWKCQLSATVVKVATKWQQPRNAAEAVQQRTTVASQSIRACLLMKLRVTIVYSSHHVCQAAWTQESGQQQEINKPGLVLFSLQASHAQLHKHSSPHQGCVRSGR